MSSSDRQHRGGLTYQAGMERLLESARGGHADGHYLYGWRRFLDAAERRLPQEGDAAEREVYVEALVHIALAAERGQLDAIAFYPAAVLQGLLAPLTPYAGVPELDGTALANVPVAWIEASRLALQAARRCAPPLSGVTAPKVELPDAPKGYVAVPPGSYTAGPVDVSPESDTLSVRDLPRRVTLTRGVFVQATEVTRGQWRSVVGRLPKGQPPCDGDLCPVSGVSWLDALKYLNKLSAREKLEPCYTIQRAEVSFVGLDCLGYRLPTDGEWEYVARAGLGGERYGSLADIATTSGASGPNRVASLASNRWGLYDTLGNVSEWCHDLYERHESGAVVDPTGTRYGVNRVTRGGSFLDPAASVRFTARESREPRSKSPAIGFRPVRTIGATP